jgi:hypothetical protein
MCSTTSVYTVQLTIFAVQLTVCAVQRPENALKILGNTVELAEM